MLFRAAVAGLLLGSAAAEESECGCAASRSSVDSAKSTTCSAETSSERKLSPAFVVDGFERLLHVSFVPPGVNEIGTNEQHFREDAEGPAFNFTLPAPGLWVDTYEVSNARFAAFVAATGHVTEAESYGWSFVHELAVPDSVKAAIHQQVQGAEWWLPVPNASWNRPEGEGTGIDGRMDHPVLHISQRDAVAFCAWSGGRLPSEGEWEYAARGGKVGRTYPWGNALMPKGEHRVNIWHGTFPKVNTGEDGHLWAAPVDSMGPQNGYGLYHVTGNVWEWTTETWCPNFSPEGRFLPRPDLRGRKSVPPECARMAGNPMSRAQAEAKFKADPGEVDYVKKGGSFLCHKSFCYRYRSAARHKNTINSSAYNLGARCVYDSKPSWAGQGASSSPSSTSVAAVEAEGKKEL